MQLNLKQLLRWAKCRCIIEINVDGTISVQMERDDFNTRYEGSSLYTALFTAYKQEKERLCNGKD